MTEIGVKYGLEDPFATLDHRPTRGTLARATLGGKYNYLVWTSVTDQKRELDLEDLGWREPGSFLGIANVPQGYWVWVEPYLMVFGFAPDEPGRISQAVQWMDYSDEQFEEATCHHKYRNLLQAIFAPEERKIHGLSLDFGYRNRSEYLNKKDLPIGFWVWIFPHWFIFEMDASKEETDTMDIAGAFEENTLIRASVEGRFQELIEVFYMPQIFQDQGEFKILGKREASQIEEFRLPGGHWIWLSPYLFIFERDLGPEEKEDPSV